MFVQMVVAETFGGCRATAYLNGVQLSLQQLDLPGLVLVGGPELLVEPHQGASSSLAAVNQGHVLVDLVGCRDEVADSRGQRATGVAYQGLPGSERGELYYLVVNAIPTVSSKK